MIALTSQLCEASSSREGPPWMRRRTRASAPPRSTRSLYLLTVGRLSRAFLDTSLIPSPFNRSLAASALRSTRGISCIGLPIVLRANELVVMSSCGLRIYTRFNTNFRPGRLKSLTVRHAVESFSKYNRKRGVGPIAQQTHLIAGFFEWLFAECLWVIRYL